MKERNFLVDCLKGYACLLVVLDHTILGIRLAGINAISPEFELWFESLIGSFHVPLFMFLSGYVYQITGKWESKGSRISFIKYKFLNLGLPYVVFSIIYIIINSYTPGTNHSNDFSDLLNIWLTPVAQYWFLYSLLLLFLVWVICTNLLDDWMILIFLTIVNIGFLAVHLDVKIWWLISAYIISFGLGVCLPRLFVDKIRLVYKIGIILIHLTAVTAFFVNDINSYQTVSELKRLLGIMSSIALISILYKNRICYNILLIINKYSFPIYLLHTIFTAAIRILLKKLGIINFEIHTFAGMIAGMGIPVVIAFFCNKFAILDFFFYPSKNIKRIKNK